MTADEVMPLDFKSDRRSSPGAAFAWAIILTILLCWLPIIGPLIAGIVAGRKARYAGLAIAAIILPALLLGGGLYWLSLKELTIGGQQVALGPLQLLIPAEVAALLGGALLGAAGAAAHVLGVLVFLAGLGWLAYQYQGVSGIIDTIRQSQTKYEPAQNVTCPDHLKKLYAAVSNYAQSWDGDLPPADRWVTALRDPMQPLADEADVHCPAVSNGHDDKFGYAMNAALGGKKLADTANKAQTPLFYDSSDLKKDAHDNVTSLPKPGRHGGRNNVVYADGTVGQK